LLVPGTIKGFCSWHNSHYAQLQLMTSPSKSNPSTKPKEESK
jgi:hypothetical protein